MSVEEASVGAITVFAERQRPTPMISQASIPPVSPPPIPVPPLPHLSTHNDMRQSGMTVVGGWREGGRRWGAGDVSEVDMTSSGRGAVVRLALVARPSQAMDWSHEVEIAKETGDGLQARAAVARAVLAHRRHRPPAHADSARAGLARRLRQLCTSSIHPSRARPSRRSTRGAGRTGRPSTARTAGEVAEAPPPHQHTCEQPRAMLVAARM